LGGFISLYENYKTLGKRAALMTLSEMERLFCGSVTKVSQTPSRVISQKGKIKVAYYPSAKDKTHTIPIFIITPLLANPFILDLCPGLSFIEYLVNQGFNVYIIDYGVPDDYDKHQGFEDYLLDYIPFAVKKVQEASGSRLIHLIGYCLGGVFALLYPALIESAPLKSMVLIATPVDFSKLGLLRSYWRNIDVDTLVETIGNIPAELILTGFNLAASIENPRRYFMRVMGSWIKIMDKNYIRKELLINRWLIESPPFPGKAFQQFIKDLLYENKLVKNKLKINGKLADLTNIGCPLLLLSHRGDIVAPPESSRALLDLASSKDVEFVEVKGGDRGHINIMVGAEGPQFTWPKVSSWLKKRSGP